MCCDNCQERFGGDAANYRIGTSVRGEHDRRFIIEPKDKSERFCCVKLDGGIIDNSNYKKCDYLIMRCKTGEILLIEFKGHHITEGYHQIISAIESLDLSKDEVEGFIICSKVSIPMTKIQEMKDKFRRSYGKRLNIYSGDRHHHPVR